MDLEYTYWKTKDGWFVGYLNICNPRLEKESKFLGIHYYLTTQLEA